MEKWGTKCHFLKSERRTDWKTGKGVVGQNKGRVNPRCPLGFQVVMLDRQLDK